MSLFGKADAECAGGHAVEGSWPPWDEGGHPAAQRRQRCSCAVGHQHPLAGWSPALQGNPPEELTVLGPLPGAPAVGGSWMLALRGAAQHPPAPVLAGERLGPLLPFGDLYPRRQSGTGSRRGAAVGARWLWCHLQGRSPGADSPCEHAGAQIKTC